MTALYNFVTRILKEYGANILGYFASLCIDSRMSLLPSATDFRGGTRVFACLALSRWPVRALFVPRILPQRSLFAPPTLRS